MMEQVLTEKQLIHKKEKIYFALAIVVSIITFLSLLLSVIGIVFLAIGIIIPLLLHALMMAYIRSNSVKLSPKQFPEVFEKVHELCRKMDIEIIPDVYVMESSGVLNAFATRFFDRSMVVLYSDIFDLINTGAEDELTFVIAHELAHIKRNHIPKRLLILPAVWIPFVSEAYSRACEYTCDRMAAYYTGNGEAAMDGLTMLAIGKSLYRQVDRTEYLYQSSQEKGFFVWLAEKLSTHPPLPKRIHQIEEFTGIVSAPLFKKAGKTVWLTASVVLLAVAITTVGIWVNSFMEAASPIWTEISAEDGSNLIKAAAERDMQAINAQLDQGIDPNYQDSEGWTALMWAAMDNNPEAIKLLHQAGADPNMYDYYEESALTKAIAQGNIEAIKALAEAGADVNLPNSYGMTPLMSAANAGSLEAVVALLEAGADPKLEDSEKMTAFIYAKRAGFKEIAELLLAEMKQK